MGLVDSTDSLTYRELKMRLQDTAVQNPGYSWSIGLANNSIKGGIVTSSVLDSCIQDNYGNLILSPVPVRRNQQDLKMMLDVHNGKLHIQLPGVSGLIEAWWWRENGSLETVQNLWSQGSVVADIPAHASLLSLRQNGQVLWNGRVE